MTNALAHRGPDGDAIFTREAVGLGHRRLSIIDHEGGHQPMATPDGSIVLTYNGEVYNYQELRTDLIALGFQFRTKSDTEVVLHAYQAWGKRCVERFEGMFAFAIADFQKNELFLARDHFGIKPLLYRATQNCFAFASEFSGLRELPDWTGDLDLFAIELYLRYQYIPAPRTVFRGVCKLPAGHRMTVRIGEPYQRIERYWKPDFSRKKSRRDEDLLVELDTVLSDSVRRHLVADVPFGAFLSGGVDSSLVVGYMAEHSNQPVRTFSIGFDVQAVNELPYARAVADHFGTEHHEEIVQFDALDSLPEVVRHYGEPFGDQSVIPTWAVSRLARQSVPMVLSGDGGDEFFAGYSSYSAWRRSIQGQQSPPDRTIRGRLRPLARRLRPSRYQTEVRPQDDPAYWTACVGRLRDEERCSLWNRDLRFLTDMPDAGLISALNNASHFSDTSQVQAVDLETFLPEDILTKVDIASMRFGLEVRPPILDRRVFTLAASIPPDQLFGHDGTGKHPLKSLLSRKLGSVHSDRKKQGFELPLAAWLRADDENRHELTDRLCSESSPLGAWFDLSAVRETIEFSRIENVWMLLVLDEWLIQQKSASKLKATIG